VFHSEEREKNEGFHPSRATHCSAHLRYFNRFSYPSLLSALDTAKKNTFCSNVRNVLSAVEAWRMTTGTTAYPDSNTLNTTIIQTATYFSQPPINPYQDNATLLSATSEATATQPDGYFYYNKGQVITWPDCGLNGLLLLPLGENYQGEVMADQLGDLLVQKGFLTLSVWNSWCWNQKGRT